MTTPLPSVFLGPPIAHRALHDRAARRPENSRAAIRAAVAAGYGIEIDLQLSADGRAMVFHDYDLKRLTAETGPVRQRSAAELARIMLTDSDGEGIPTLQEVLEIVAGRVALLVEIKDQDGAMGGHVGALEQAAAADLRGYAGPIAVMSFNPESVAAFADLAPSIPRGLTTSAFDPNDWHLPGPVCDRLRDIPDLDRVGASFISHEARDLARDRVKTLRADGLPVLCWTIRSEDADRAARALADNVTFEGYAAKAPT